MSEKNINVKLMIATASYFLMTNVFAAEQAVKEETSPPVAETAITPDQIPPIMTTKPTPAPGTPTNNSTPPETSP